MSTLTVPVSFVARSPFTFSPHFSEHRVLFAAARPTEVFLLVPHPPCQIQLQTSFGFPNQYLHAQTVSRYPFCDLTLLLSLVHLGFGFKFC